MENKILIGYAVRKMNDGKCIGAHSLASKLANGKLQYSTVSVKTYKNTSACDEANRATIEAVKKLKSSKHAKEFNLIIGSNKDVGKQGGLSKQTKKAMDSLSKTYYIQMDPKLDKTLASVNKLNKDSIDKYIKGIKADKAKKAKLAKKQLAQQKDAKKQKVAVKQQLASTGKLPHNLDSIAGKLSGIVKEVKAQSKLADDVRKFGKLMNDKSKVAPKNPSVQQGSDALHIESSNGSLSANAKTDVIRHLVELPHRTKISRDDIKKWIIEDTHKSDVSKDQVTKVMNYLADKGFISDNHTKYHKVYLQIRHGWFA